MIDVSSVAFTELRFETVRGNKFNRDSLAKRINKRLRKLGIQDHKKGVHIFRHTFGIMIDVSSVAFTELRIIVISSLLKVGLIFFASFTSSMATGKFDTIYTLAR